jgi:hypothetical protein
VGTSVGPCNLLCCKLPVFMNIELLLIHPLHALQVSVRLSDLRSAGTGKHRCTVSLYSLPSLAVSTGASAPMTAVSNLHISEALDEDRAVATYKPTADSTQGQIIANLTFVHELLLDVRHQPDGTLHTSFLSFQCRIL